MRPGLDRFGRELRIEDSPNSARLHMAEMFSQEEAIFHTALAIDAADQRAAYLDTACGNQDGLRRRVEALLRRFAEAEGPLDRPGLHLSATLDKPLRERPSRRIGPYKLLCQAMRAIAAVAPLRGDTPYPMSQEDT